MGWRSVVWSPSRKRPAAGSPAGPARGGGNTANRALIIPLARQTAPPCHRNSPLWNTVAAARAPAAERNPPSASGRRDLSCSKVAAGRGTDVLPGAEAVRSVSSEQGDALRSFRPHAAPWFARITEEFYARLDEHEEARRVFTGDEQRARLRQSLMAWMDRLLNGPWDDDYYQARARIGRMHVRVGLPQRYMFGAMNVIRSRLAEVAEEALASDPQVLRETRLALDRIIDLELAIMLETYRKPFLKRSSTRPLEKRPPGGPAGHQRG